MKSRAILLRLAVPVLVMLLSGVAVSQNDNQVQYWNEWSGSWETWDPFFGHADDVDSGDLVDVIPVEGDPYFQWTRGLYTLRIKKNKLPKKSVKEAFQKAADDDVRITIHYNSDGKLTKVELKEKPAN